MKDFDKYVFACGTSAAKNKKEIEGIFTVPMPCKIF
jgi:hypothetical protein